MSDQERTGGPWEAYLIKQQPGRQDDTIHVYAPDHGPSEICECSWPSDYAPGVAMANMRLAAAAPELLVALTEVIDSHPLRDDTLWANAREAIRKATGGDR